MKYFIWVILFFGAWFTHAQLTPNSTQLGVHYSTSNRNLDFERYSGHTLGMYVINRTEERWWHLGLAGELMWLSHPDYPNDRTNEWQGLFYTMFAVTGKVNKRGGVYLELNPFGFHTALNRSLSEQSSSAGPHSPLPFHYLETSGVYFGGKLGYEFYLSQGLHNRLRLYVGSNVLRLFNVGLIYIF
jgi:hypothetical protein